MSDKKNCPHTHKQIQSEGEETVTYYCPDCRHIWDEPLSESRILKPKRPK